MMADVESFNSTILSLEGQSKNCKVHVSCGSLTHCVSGMFRDVNCMLGMLAVFRDVSCV